MEQGGDVTQLLGQWKQGDREALDQLVGLVYPQLKRLAQKQLVNWDKGQTLSATALVNEGFMKLAGQRNLQLENRQHFLAVAARAMRQILVDYARAKTAEKRGGGQINATLDENQMGDYGDIQTVLMVDEVLQGLEDLGERYVQVVECRYFAGMTAEETADALDISVRTVQRDWIKAQAWMREYGKL
jgi:RNA polymerase sigma factor (TIGR02999 family)